MAVSQSRNKLPGTSFPLSALPSHRVEALASVVSSAKGVILFLTLN